MYDIYSKLRDAKNLRDSDVSKETGIARSTFTDWKNGRSVPKSEKLIKIAEFLGVSYEYLVTGKDKDIEMPMFQPEHIELISLYSKLNEEQKKTVMTLLKTLALQD